MREANKQNPGSLAQAPAEPGRDALIADAAEAEQQILLDELEEHASYLRRACGENLEPLGRAGVTCSLAKGHMGGHKR